MTTIIIACRMRFTFVLLLTKMIGQCATSWVLNSHVAQRYADIGARIAMAMEEAQNGNEIVNVDCKRNKPLVNKPLQILAEF